MASLGARRKPYQLATDGRWDRRRRPRARVGNAGRADAAVATIRLKLLKLGALVRTSVRRIHFAIASGCPNKDEFELAHIYLQRAFSSA